MRYYVVVRGRETGIFRSLDYVRDQVLGFPNAKYRGFEYMEEAEDYLKQHIRDNDADEEILNDYDADDRYDDNQGNQRFYAVVRGRQLGVFTSWKECRKLVSGYSFQHVRRFDTYEEAARYYEKRSRRCYAVLRGRQTGVIPSWEGCQDLVLGYLRHYHRRFNSYKRAKEFYKYERKNYIQDDSSSSNNYISGYGDDDDNSSATSQEVASQPFYAVVLGHQIGVFNSFEYCKEQVANYPNGLLKKCNSYAEALDCLCEHDYLLPAATYQGRVHTKPKIKMNLEDFDHPPSEFGPERLSPRSALKTIYTDGACKGNGTGTGAAGYGVFYSLGSKHNALVPLKCDATNQRAELMAIRHALISIANLLYCNDAWRAYDFEIVSDSKYAIQAVSEFSDTWCRNGWLTSDGSPVKNQDLIREMVRLYNFITSCGVCIVWTHVSGHSDNQGNDLADALANEGADILQYH